MLAEGVSQITIDLAGVGFVDSSGLRLFIVLDQRATSEGWTLALTRPTPQALTADSPSLTCSTKPRLSISP